MFMRVAGHKWLRRRMGAGCLVFSLLWLWRMDTGKGRRERKSYAEVAEGIAKLFENALNQCLCGLQGINGWEGAWGLLVGGLLCFGLCGLWASWFNPASY